MNKVKVNAYNDRYYSSIVILLYEVAFTITVFIRKRYPGILFGIENLKKKIK